MEVPCDLLHRRPQHTDHNASSADLRDPAIFTEPHGNRRTLQAAVVELFFGGYLSRLFLPWCGSVSFRARLSHRTFVFGFFCLSRQWTPPTACLFRRVLLPRTRLVVFPLTHRKL